MKKIVVHGREMDQAVLPQLARLFDLLNFYQIHTFVSKEFWILNSSFLENYEVIVLDHNSVPNDTDVLISLGGDGTFLDSLTFIGSKETPILGINTGRLGFLASVNKDEIDLAIHRLFKNQFSIERRSLVQLKTDQNYFGNLNYALNEFAILRKDTSSMIAVQAHLNGRFLNKYWADGVMVATPTGSTGYSLSCGGPIILPQTLNFILTPVSPHNLNIRPLIVPDSSELEFEVESRQTSYLVSLDSRSITIDEATKLYVSKAPFNACLVRIDGSDIIETLRNKLSWGLDKRN